MTESSNSVEKMVVVRLYGKTGALFGREHRLSVGSVREALRALCIMLPGFERWLETSQQRGVTYTVFNGEKNLAEKDLLLDGVHDVIRIAPILIGSKQAGLLQTIFGAVLVVVGAVLSAYSMGGGTPLIQAGIGLMVGGVMQMLSPVATMGVTNTEDTRKSYSFGSPANMSAAGSGLPILYGQREIGGVLISGGIYAEQQQ